VQLENKALVLDLLEFVSREPRTYSQVMEAWRTSCPKLPVWEDALGHGFVRRVQNGGAGAVVEVTPAGRSFLDSERPA
jgi:hypothetical protein